MAMTNALDRRTLLHLAGASAGTAALAGASLAGPEPAGAATTAFRHGVASDDPLPDGILVWTRVAPTPDALPGSAVGPDVEVSWQVATDLDQQHQRQPLGGRLVGGIRIFPG
jgi:alkaline phosphatase D